MRTVQCPSVSMCQTVSVRAHQWSKQAIYVDVHGQWGIAPSYYIAARFSCSILEQFQKLFSPLVTLTQKHGQNQLQVEKYRKLPFKSFFSFCAHKWTKKKFTWVLWKVSVGVGTQAVCWWFNERWTSELYCFLLLILRPGHFSGSF